MNIIAFVSFVFANCYTPGPSNIMAMTNAQRYGIRGSIRPMAGMVAGYFLVASEAMLINLTLPKLLPHVEIVMRWLGAGYMLYLAWLILRNGEGGKSEAGVGINTFRAGILLQLLNIKGILFFFSLTSVFILPYYRETSELVMFCVLLTLVGFSALSCWALLGVVFNRFLQRYGVFFNWVMAILLVYCAGVILALF